jgi:hypothetical protein
VTDEATRAERKLAALVLTELDIDIEPAKLRDFVRKHWRTLAPLAHVVHEAPDYTKSSPGLPSDYHPGRTGY